MEVRDETWMTAGFQTEMLLLSCIFFCMDMRGWRDLCVVFCLAIGVAFSFPVEVTFSLFSPLPKS